ncbi:MAG TPA: hypothetical protein VFU54_04805 [Actinomycetota bacterium]|nr:hypothetical protein [Actinomycetota bacterium]
MKRLLVVATVVAAAVSLGVLAALVVGPSPARSVPAIELVTTSSTAPAATTTDGAGEQAAPAKPGRDDGPATSPREPGGDGTSPAPSPSPAPAGGGDDDDDGDDEGGDD